MDSYLLKCNVFTGQLWLTVPLNALHRMLNSLDKIHPNRQEWPLKKKDNKNFTQQHRNKTQRPA